MHAVLGLFVGSLIGWAAFGRLQMSPPAIGDPLQHAVDQIRANPAFAQSQLLKRILVAMVTGGNFRRAEATALDASTHALVMSLLELRRTGARSRQSWSDAIGAAEAASA